MNDPARPFWRRHSHSWITVAETYAVPRAGSLKTGTVDGPQDFVQAESDRFRDLCERLAFGCTTVSQRCRECGEQRSYVVTGDARTEGQVRRPKVGT